MNWGTLQEKFPDLQVREDYTVLIQASDLVDVCQMLKTEFHMDFLKMMTAIDWKDHLELVYGLYSYTHRIDCWVRVKVESPFEIQTVSSIWQAANWHERECYDLFGVNFLGHPNLKRLLLPEDWKGHPLRKDYVQEDTALGVSTKRTYLTELPRLK